MKKIALTVAAVAALGLAACNNEAGETNNATDLNATELEAGNDVDAAANDAGAATENALDSVADTAENLAEDAGNLADEAAEAADNQI